MGKKLNHKQPKEGYGDSVAQLRRDTKNLSTDQIEDEIKNREAKR